MKIASLFLFLSVLSCPAQAAEFWSNLTCTADQAKLTVVELPTGDAQITLANPAGLSGTWKSVGQSTAVGFYQSVKFPLEGVAEPLWIGERKNFGRGGPIGVVTSAKVDGLFLYCGSDADFLE